MESLLAGRFDEDHPVTIMREGWLTTEGAITHTHVDRLRLPTFHVNICAVSGLCRLLNGERGSAVDSAKDSQEVLARSKVPESDGLGSGAGDDGPVVWCDGHSPDIASVTDKLAHFLACLSEGASAVSMLVSRCIPKGNGVAIARKAHA